MSSHSDTQNDLDMPVVKSSADERTQLEARVAAVRSALDDLEQDLRRSAESSGKSAESSPKDEPNNAAFAKLEQELKRTRQELAQRRIELTEVRKEAARALQRAEQENERLREEVLVAQRFMQDALSSKPPAASKTRKSSSEPPKRSVADTERPSTPPVASGRKNRQSADTMRPHARTRGR